MERRSVVFVAPASAPVREAESTAGQKESHLMAILTAVVRGFPKCIRNSIEIWFGLPVVGIFFWQGRIPVMLAESHITAGQILEAPLPARNRASAAFIQTMTRRYGASIASMRTHFNNAQKG